MKDEIKENDIMSVLSKSISTVKEQYDAIDGFIAEIQHINLVNPNNDNDFNVYYESIILCEDRAYKHAKVADTLLNLIKEFDKLTLSEDEAGFKWLRK